jgi:hypothetical protein
MKPSSKTLLWVTIYSIAMGFLETAVVVYLRKLYYPDGFAFPLAPVHNDIAVVELWRELATLFMLVAIGILAGRNRAEKFAYFLFSFAVWDIFYYVFLWVFLSWPESLMTWDILFLLPVPWVGPVITPCIIAATMIAFTFTVIRFTDRQAEVAMKAKERWLIWLGALVVIISFTIDYVNTKGATLWRNISDGDDLFKDLSDYVPQTFNWWIFAAGELLIIAACLMYRQRLVKQKPARQEFFT